MNKNMKKIGYLLVSLIILIYSLKCMPKIFDKVSIKIYKIISKLDR